MKDFDGNEFSNYVPRYFSPKTPRYFIFGVWSSDILKIFQNRPSFIRFQNLSIWILNVINVLSLDDGKISVNQRFTFDHSN